MNLTDNEKRDLVKLIEAGKPLPERIYFQRTRASADSFIAMIYERLVLMRDLPAEDGSIYVHCDWRVNSFMRLAMDEVCRGFSNGCAFTPARTSTLTC